MKHGKSIVELAQELTRRKEAAKDYVAPVSRLTAVSVTQAIENSNGAQDIRLELKNGESKYLPMSDWAHSQLATYTDIPKSYYDRIRGQNSTLLADSVNHGLRYHGGRDQRLVRTVDNKVTALLSPRYRRLDSFELMDAVLPPLMEHGFNVESSEVTEKRTYIKAITAKLEGEVKVGDPVQFGLVVSNSDVGAGALRIEPMIYRLVCLNGMISQSAIRKNHIGKSMLGDGDDINELLSDRTRELTDAAFWHQVRDVVTASMRPDIFQRELDRLKEAAGLKITNFALDEVIELASSHVGVSSEATKKSMLAYLANGADGAGLTKWGLANAFTYAAQAADIDYDTATDLERAGSQIITLAPRDWSRIAEKAS